MKKYLFKLSPFIFFLFTYLNVSAQCDGGTITNSTGSTNLMSCTQDGNSDVHTFMTSGSSGTSIAYVVTDPNGIIIGLPPSNMVDFDGAPPGTCWIWAVAYDGNFTAEAGDDANTVAFSDDCYDLSDNFVTIVREGGSAGTISTVDGAAMVYTCTQDGNVDEVSFQTMDATGTNIAYVVTDPDLNILGLPPGNTVDFDGAPPGTCWVWALAYTGNITAQVGDNAGTTALTDGCANLSENFVEVIRDVVVGGTIAREDGTNTITTCTMDSIPDVVQFVSTGASNSKIAYVITSPTLEILGLEFNDFHDFDGAPPGTCWVWTMAYTGNITAQVGDIVGNVSLTDDCADLSTNFIEVIRTDNGDACLSSTSDISAQNAKLKVFPNPVGDQLFFELDESVGQDAVIYIYSSIGEVIQKFNYKQTNGSLNVYDLQSGYYLISVQDKNQSFSKAFIKN